MGFPVGGDDDVDKPTLHDLLSSEALPDLSTFRVRDPGNFQAGGLHGNYAFWTTIIADHPHKEMILSWIQNRVDVRSFIQPFTGHFKGHRYDSAFPPSKVFSNNLSCKQFTDFIAEAILSRLQSGAVKVWGRVTEVDPPFIVLPLTVEPTKPRLCIDARFVNLWVRDNPFSLDTLVDVTRYVYQNSYMTKCDDKSGYDHVLLQTASREYFGFQWSGWWFVCTTLPFGWKASPFIYHSIGLVASSYLRSTGIPCSLYIDDRLNSELVTQSGPWSRPILQRTDQYRFAAATAAIAIVIVVLTRLGYTLGLKKSVLVPVKQLEYLGFIVDSEKQAFIIPPRKIASFAALRESLLKCQLKVGVKTLQRFQGKCIAFSAAVPAAKLYIRCMSAAIGSHVGLEAITIGSLLREEIGHWRFLDTWTGFVPWRQEKHVRLSLSTDASKFRWGGIIHGPVQDQEIGDYWSSSELRQDISCKELLAVFYALVSLPNNVRDCRVDIQVDSMVVLHVINGHGSKKSSQLTTLTKQLYTHLAERNIQLEVKYVPSASNPADTPSRRLGPSDARLSPSAWHRIQQVFGGFSGHSFDLMALDSNAQLDYLARPLPHFTPVLTPQSHGVNLFAQDLNDGVGDFSNPYVFPPFSLVPPVLRFLLQFKRPFTIVVPDLCPRPFW